MIQANETVKALVTFEVRRSVQLPPDQKDSATPSCCRT